MSKALKIWREKLEAARIAEARAVSVAEQFGARKEIEEAQKKIEELEAEQRNSGLNGNQHVTASGEEFPDPHQHSATDPASAIGQQREELRRLVMLSILGLGLDRFKEGGWGFSMGADFERDDDGRLLQRGRYELNLLVLRALRWVLPEKEFYDESRSALLWSLDQSKSPRSGMLSLTQPIVAGSNVKDRKQRAIALTTLLNSYSSNYFGSCLHEHINILKEEVRYSPPNQRWVFQQSSSISSYDDVIFFDFYSRARNFKDHPILSKSIDSNKIEENHKQARESFKFWQNNNQIIPILYDRVFKPLAHMCIDMGATELAKTRRFAAPKELDSLLLYLRIICSLQESALMLINAPAIAAIRGIATELTKLVAHAKSSPSDDDVRKQLIRIFPVYLLAMQDLAYHDDDLEHGSAAVKEHFKFCNSLWMELIDHFGATGLGLLMNAAGWASTVIMCERMNLDVDKKNISELWVMLRQTRENRRLNAIDAVRSSQGTAREKFDNFIMIEFGSFGKKFSSSMFPSNIEALECRQMFSFGGSVVPKQALRLGNAVGLLLVDTKADQVIAATAGFNAIYIQPFSARLGLGINSLERMIFELGETDTEFVDALSNSVVVDCWPVSDQGQAALKGFNFQSRTLEVRKAVEAQVLNSRDDPGISYRDLLKLRTESDQKFRFVLRSCSQVHPEDLIGIAPADLSITNADRLILLTFNDVTSWAEAGLFGILSPHLSNAVVV